MQKRKKKVTIALTYILIKTKITFVYKKSANVKKLKLVRCVTHDNEWAWAKRQRDLGSKILMHQASVKSICKGSSFIWPNNLESNCSM